MPIWSNRTLDTVTWLPATMAMPLRPVSPQLESVNVTESDHVWLP